MPTLKEKMSYYTWVSYRRRTIDELLKKNSSLFRGVVLDIGGRNRGHFKKPVNKVEKWIFADIEEKHYPDMVLDVMDMAGLDNESIDVINATELFEHVVNPEQGLKECYRVLKPNGTIIISMPFLYQIHADPFDFQRWTDNKWKKVLRENNFEIEKFEIMGRFFTVLAESKRVLINSLPPILKWSCYILFPIWDVMTWLDKSSVVKKHPVLGKYHGGYFIIGTKNK
ncbi:class I SAM-dependent methyltransferase [Patescibacteria group bacterium]|nr:class I SAM-dependent methyltransferase [Patescibacteria group bacterium]MBU1889982.1 class I SAM-dependent methyltransferase [Patescibacteria group bacterium]